MCQKSGKTGGGSGYARFRYFFFSNKDLDPVFLLKGQFCNFKMLNSVLYRVLTRKSISSGNSYKKIFFLIYIYITIGLIDILDPIFFLSKGYKKKFRSSALMEIVYVFVLETRRTINKMINSHYYTPCVVRGKHIGTPLFKINRRYCCTSRTNEYDCTALLTRIDYHTLKAKG